MRTTRAQKKAISDVWFDLMKRKKVQVKTVNDVIEKSMLSEKQLANPKIADSVRKHGKYWLETILTDDKVQALDTLVDLGYVRKRTGKVYEIYLAYTASPYIPLIYPDGNLGVLLHTTMSRSTFSLSDEQYGVFVDSFKKFEAAMKSGRHNHITMLNHGVVFNYSTDIYEVEDDFFDAIMLEITDSGTLECRLSEPYINTIDKKSKTIESKNWKPLAKISRRRFLKGKKDLEKVVRKLPWKNDYIGMMEGNDHKVWTMTKNDPTKTTGKKQTKEDSYIPNVFSKGLYSYENTMGRIFEYEVAEYFRKKEHYITTTRVTPTYLRKEIDVFGEKNTIKHKKIIICECKFRINNRPITKSELDLFQEKCSKIKKNESKIGSNSFRFCMVTNTDQIDEDARKFLKNTKIEFMQAVLPRNWNKRSDWSINEMRRIASN